MGDPPVQNGQRTPCQADNQALGGRPLLPHVTRMGRDAVGGLVSAASRARSGKPDAPIPQRYSLTAQANEYVDGATEQTDNRAARAYTFRIGASESGRRAEKQRNIEDNVVGTKHSDGKHWPTLFRPGRPTQPGDPLGSWRICSIWHSARWRYGRESGAMGLRKRTRSLA